jgi:hypothetical protein
LSLARGAFRGVAAERVLTEQDRIRAEIGGLRHDIRVIAATLLRIDQWIAAQTPPP